MTIKELRSILEFMLHGILTYDNSDYEFHEMLHGIEIRFKYGNYVRCYLTVYTSGYMREVINPFHNDFLATFEKCIQALNNTKTYLEILGFKTI